MELLLLVIGMIGLWLSAELLIRSCQIIAKKLKMSDTFIGLTVLSVGTTLPELGTHIVSSLEIVLGKAEASGIAVGTNVGSNIMQTTFILGVIALFTRVKASEMFLNKDYLVMLGSILLLFILSLNGSITRIEGFFLAFLYIMYLKKLGQKEHFVDKIGNNQNNKNLFLQWIFIIVGIGLLLFTAKVVVDNALILSNKWGVEQSLIGVLIVGVGTALPEFAAAVVGIKRKAMGMSVGLLVGSNITNPLFGLGVGALISTYRIGSNLLWFDIPFWFGVSLLAWAFLRRKNVVTRNEALFLVILYIVYVLVRLKLGLNL